MSTTIPTHEEPPVRRGGWHPVSVGHLVMGVAFLGLTLVGTLILGDVVEGEDIRFLMPLPWVLAGIAGLVALVLRDRSKLQHPEAEAWGVSSMRGWVAGPETETSPQPDVQPEVEPTVDLDKHQD